MWYALLFNFAVFPLTNGLMPYAAKEIFDTDQTGLGYLIASVAAGAFIGSIVMTRSGMRVELARIMIVAAVIWHILVLVFAQTTALWAGIVMLMLCGFAQSLTMVSHTVILLQRVDPALPRPHHGGPDAGYLQPADRAPGGGRADRLDRLSRHGVALCRGRSGLHDLDCRTLARVVVAGPNAAGGTAPVMPR